MKAYLAEFFGTFIMVLVGTSTIVASSYFSLVNNLVISASFGIIVMTMIYVFRGTSGAHINPAVSLAFFFHGGFKPVKIFDIFILSASWRCCRVNSGFFAVSADQKFW